MKNIKLKNEYVGFVDDVYEGWFVVSKPINKKDEFMSEAIVVYSGMMYEENKVRVVFERWAVFADGTWGCIEILSDEMEYDYSEETDKAIYNQFVLMSK